MRTVAFLPAKGASERIPNKNLRCLNGEPLFVRTLKKLLLCPEIDEVYVDSDSEVIREIAVSYGSKVLVRPSHLATNETDGHELFAWEVSQVPGADIYVQSLCTSPFVDPERITYCVYNAKSYSHCDSVAVGHTKRDYKWDDNGPTYGERIPNSDTLPATICEGMSLYVVKGEAARTTGRRIGATPIMLSSAPLEHLDINTEEDWQLAELVATGMAQKEAQRFSVMKQVLSSAILADAGAIPLRYNLSPNMPSKLFGRARTMEIGVGAGSIYEAMNHYEYVGSGDVLLVGNYAHDAYFGGLNTLLAQRAGASGAVILGPTRDCRQTVAAGFPVFSQGRTSHDVKEYGCVKSLNTPIGGVFPGDLLFADEDGVVHIPWREESAILTRALEIARKEGQVRHDIVSGVSLSELKDKKF